MDMVTIFNGESDKRRGDFVPNSNGVLHLSNPRPCELSEGVAEGKRDMSSV